ncbi:hypothetical protein GGF32_003833 [Allomyces javanicus]|nr:hypothetical protein GGF32_003833 [Allomyces javanicus]
MTRLVVPTSLTGASVRRFLTQHHAIPSAKLHALLSKRRIYVVTPDSQSATRVTDLALRLAGGEVVVLDAKVDVFEPEPVEEVDVDMDVVERVKAWIVHDDDRMVVINKPGGVAVQGGSGINAENTVAGMLPAIARAGTTGLVILGKSLAATQEIAGAFHDRMVDKEYLAFLDTSSLPTTSLRPSPTTTTLTHRAVRRTLHGDRTLLLPLTSALAPTDRDLGTATTSYRVLARAPTAALVHFMPATGRKHQLRAFAAGILGAPIVGDGVYGTYGRDMMLHLARMRVDGMELCAPVPRGMVEACRAAGIADGLMALGEGA